MVLHEGASRPMAQPDGAVEGGDRWATEDQGIGSALEEAAAGSDRGRRQLFVMRCLLWQLLEGATVRA
jgi:hypothetical protein